MPDRRAHSASHAIIAAARTQVAEEGLRGLSLRKVAARAGSGRGGVTYQAGHKSNLVASLIADSLEFQQSNHRRWLELTASLDVSSNDVLATVVGSFLDEAATTWRSQSLVLCELVAEASRRRESHADLAVLVRAQEAFWRDLQRDSPHAAILGWAIANYCRDELPFALALYGRAEYHLLRNATVARLVQRAAPMAPHGFAKGFDCFAASVQDRLDDAVTSSVPGESRSSAIGRAIAGLIHREGVAGVTHRSVAAAAGIPKSSIAHHFRTREDLLKAGLSEIYRQLTEADRLLALEDDVMPDMTLSIASHSIAIEATRDALLVPSALSLRTRRGEFIWGELETSLGPGRTDFAALQAAGMVIVGAGLGLHLAGGEKLLPLALLEDLYSLRADAT